MLMGAIANGTPESSKCGIVQMRHAQLEPLPEHYTHLRSLHWNFQSNRKRRVFRFLKLLRMAQSGDRRPDPQIVTGRALNTICFQLLSGILRVFPIHITRSERGNSRGIQSVRYSPLINT